MHEQRLYVGKKHRQDARKSARKEHIKNGLVILFAKYECEGRPTEDIIEEYTFPAFINVTVPLQCMVTNSSLHIANGTQYYSLDGFYDLRDTEGHELVLSINYRYQNLEYSVSYMDGDEIQIPNPTAVPVPSLGDYNNESSSDEDE